MNSIDRLAATAVSRRPIRLGIERSTPLESPLAALLAADDEADTRTFDTVSVESGSFGELDEAHLRVLAEAMADRFGVRLDDDARDVLVSRTVDSRSAPVYIETALLTADGQFTVDDVETLGEEVKHIWQSQYDHLQTEAPNEWRVLAAMTFVDDISGPQYVKFLRAVYCDLLGGDRGWFRTAVEGLHTRQWLTIDGTDTVALESQYEVHDTQLEAVRVSAGDDAEHLSTVLLEKGDKTIPDRHRSEAHFYAGLAFQRWDHHSLSKTHYETAIDLAPEDARAHNNYALLLKTELDASKKAGEHYETAIDLDPESAFAHYGYAELLAAELDSPEVAASHFETAIDLSSKIAEKLFDPDRDSQKRVLELYLHGLTRVATDGGDQATDLLREAWTLREELTDRYPAVAAGVWCVWLQAGNVESDAVEQAATTIEPSRSPVLEVLTKGTFTERPLPEVAELDGEVPYDIEIHAYETLIDRQ